MSPSRSAIGGSPMSPPQHEPFVMTWYSMTCSAPGRICGATVAAGGVSATHGGEPSTRKKTAPVSLTARRTSERVSVLTQAPLPYER